MLILLYYMATDVKPENRNFPAILAGVIDATIFVAALKLIGGMIA